MHCVSYPALGEPAKLSRANRGTRCFACEERRLASEPKMAAANDNNKKKKNKKKAAERGKAKEPPWLKKSSDAQLVVGVHIGREHTEEAEGALELLERRRRSVRRCEGGLRWALASGNKRLVGRWSGSLREAEERLAWAEADHGARGRKRGWSGRAG